jgi:hypothetical protein
MVSTLGSGEQLNQTRTTSHILVANDSEIWRKYQQVDGLISVAGAVFAGWKQRIHRKDTTHAMITFFTAEALRRREA